MDTILVATASRHGSTEELGRAIASDLAHYGFTVEVRRMVEVDTVFPYDALVLGSAVYMGDWLKEAREFVDLHRDGIVTRPTWLFSSGPIGDEGPTSQRYDASRMVERTRARDHHLFGGRIDKAALRFRERVLAGLVSAPETDERDWAVATAWAAAIARALTDERTPV